MELLLQTTITVSMTSAEALDLGLASYDKERNTNSGGAASKFYDALPDDLRAEIRRQSGDG